MQDAEAVTFLQWALPRLGLRWRGFRKVRRQVRKRLSRRLDELALPDLTSYRERLAGDPEEWRQLDALCRISISRFHRDRGVFADLTESVLPALAERALGRGARKLRCWSAGCASGEEPYTLAILWNTTLVRRFPELAVEILASDADEHMLARADAGLYPESSLRELPGDWRRAAFEQRGDEFRLRRPFRSAVRFERRDLRDGQPGGVFDLVLCRNLVLTYFDDVAQRDALETVREVLVPGGAFVVGLHESLPDGVAGLATWRGARCIYRRTASATRS